MHREGATSGREPQPGRAPRKLHAARDMRLPQFHLDVTEALAGGVLDIGSFHGRTAMMPQDLGACAGAGAIVLRGPSSTDDDWRRSSQAASAAANAICIVGCVS